MGAIRIQIHGKGHRARERICLHKRAAGTIAFKHACRSDQDFAIASNAQRILWCRCARGKVSQLRVRAHIEALDGISFRCVEHRALVGCQIVPIRSARLRRWGKVHQESTGRVEFLEHPCPVGLANIYIRSGIDYDRFR